MAKLSLKQEGVWRTNGGHGALQSHCFIYLPSLWFHAQNSSLVAYLAFYVSVYKESIAHHLGCEYFGFYGSDLD